jgi:hypothetical protein
MKRRATMVLNSFQTIKETFDIIHRYSCLQNYAVFADSIFVPLN